jgi:hypothetical protein
VTQFGIALIEKQHKFFLDDSIDNSEHVPAIKRISDAAYEYLKAQEVNVDIAKKVKAELINHGRDLFVQAWMTSDEDEDPLDEEERREAKRTFDQLLRGE